MFCLGFRVVGVSRLLGGVQSEPILSEKPETLNPEP